MKTQIDICANNLLNYQEKFKALSDEYRLDILNILSKNGETCVCDLSELLELSQSRLSYHLKILLDADFISVDRKSTRLNSSHVSISYAVFCLQKIKAD